MAKCFGLGVRIHRHRGQRRHETRLGDGVQPLLHQLGIFGLLDCLPALRTFFREIRSSLGGGGFSGIGHGGQIQPHDDAAILLSDFSDRQLGRLGYLDTRMRRFSRTLGTQG